MHEDQAIDPDPVVHPGNQHVRAVAVAAGADAIVTENLRHFPADALSPHGIAVLSIDAFLKVLFEQSPTTVTAIISEQAADLGAPSVSPAELLAHLAQWAPGFAASIQK